jgi:hypothetical protein
MGLFATGGVLCAAMPLKESAVIEAYCAGVSVRRGELVENSLTA